MKYSTYIFTENGLVALKSGRYADTDKRNTFGPIFRELANAANASETPVEASGSDVIESLLADEAYAPTSAKYRNGDRNARIKFIREYINFAGSTDLIAVPE